MLPHLSFLLGIVVIGYLCTFVVFAVLRIVTGVSIQRLGFSGLARIAFSPRHGVKITVRGVGVRIHRPTFALPTWCSLVIRELVVTVDLNALAEGQVKVEKGNGVVGKERGGPKPAQEVHEDEHGRGRLWRRLTDVKEKIKRLHSKIGWIKLVDLLVTDTTLNVVGVASVQLERLSLSVDTRSKTVDRSRLFQHHKTKPETQSPAEWKSMIRSILFTPEGRDSTEVLDYATVNVHGMLHNELQGLRDASVAVKLGRLNVPYDDLEYAKRCADMLRGRYGQPYRESTAVRVSNALHELEPPENRADNIVRAVSDSRAFVASILRGIQEVQFAISFFGLSRKMDVRSDTGKDVYFNLAMKEIGLDVLRLDPKSPAHRMYFSTKDVAHQGLLTAIAISAGIDDGHEHPERMVYVPMVTATVRTTLPSRTIHYSQQNNASDRNTNMLYAHFVCTSPSIDLDPKHLPLVREMLKRQSSTPSPAKAEKHANRHHLISQLLPKAYIKLSVQEPVIRVSLPPMDKASAAEDDYDLLISSVSSIAIELESSHAAEGGLHYSLGTHYRHVRHHLYYQTFAGERHDLLHSDTVELQVDVNALPDASVVASGRLQTFTIFLVRPEISEGVRQIVKQLRRNVLAPRHDGDEQPRMSFLRRTPAWLQQCRIEGSDFGLELAGVDEQVSKDRRGFLLQLETWTTEYKAQRDEKPDMFTRRHSLTRAVSLERKQTMERSESPRRRQKSLADDRRLTVHLQNLEGFITDSLDNSEPASFLSVPRFEVACSTSTDNNGPLFHINSHARSVLLQYSLYNHFAMCVAVMVIRKTFMDLEREKARQESRKKPRRQQLQVPGDLTNADEVARHEITTIDFKANLVQLKARMPADPPMMMQLFGLETGRHRYGTPFVRCKVARLYVRAPRTKSVWSRIVSFRNLRLDIREFRRKAGKTSVSEKSVDVVADVIRIGVPHSLVVHNIFDNITNVIKTTKQLNHHFVTGTNQDILIKEPEGPKHVPRITVRVQLLGFDIEDSAFEYKLNSIYRAGLIEQKQRLAREDAFSLKEKRMARSANDGRRASGLRARSAHPDQRSRSRNRAEQPGNAQRSRSTHEPSRWSPQTSQRQGRHGHRQMRYNTEGKCDISDSSHLGIAAARDKLDRLNAQAWKHRIDRVNDYQSSTIKEMRKLMFASDDLPEESEQNEPILAISQRPGLLVAMLSDLAITIDKPSFPIDEYPKFLHDIGKAMPHDMKYGLLLPMNLNITMGEARFQLRDYPLPLLHVPALASGQSPRMPSLSLKTDFVIAEEFRDVESQRRVNVEVVPVDKMSTGKAFSVNVWRTISPVKTYSDMKFEINTSRPTKITWGTSYQPAIQDTMQVVEAFTKPPVDTSDRVGFWDKIRLSFHSRVNVAWKGDGDVHLVLKGSRDPYVVTGNGAGLVMVWRNDVQWNIAQSDDPRQFMTVDSSDFILAIPDFSGYARMSQEFSESNSDSASGSSVGSFSKDAVFKKVVMKLSGKVRWLGGMVFERDLKDGTRSFDFKPHYDVVLKHPHYAKAPPGEEFDAYDGFRSHHIHASVAVAAPYDRQWSVENIKPSDNYNAIHLTPRFFSHFFSWWSMFSGVMSLPIKQGPLWGGMQKKSKKLGRHLATLKYNLLLSPLFISHVYKHKDAEDYQENVVSATGLKMRLDSFMLDLHQRREYFDIKGHEGAQSKTSSGIRINQAQLDFIHADLRALSASIAGTRTKDIEKANDESLASLYGQQQAVDMSKFTIPDQDFSWIDMDDFVELDWILPAESDPETKILPLGYAPRFTYFRQTDHHGVIASDPTRRSSFGDEPTHYCVMSAKNDPRLVQVELIEKRLSRLREQKAHNERAAGDAELKYIQSTHSDQADRDKCRETLETLQTHSEHLQRKYNFLQKMLSTLSQRLEDDDPSAVPDLETSEAFFEAHEHAQTPGPMEENVNLDSAPLADYTSDFNNRFIVHNAQIKWNNSLRNIILRYIHQVSQRRGFVYYMSRRAVKFILDVIEEKRKTETAGTANQTKSPAADQGPLSPDSIDDDATIQDRIEQILKDGRSFVHAEDPEYDDKVENVLDTGNPSDEISMEYTPLNTYHFRLIAPQIQLQSEKNTKAAVLVTTKGMQLKVVQIMDKDRVSDDVSGLVQRRFRAAADSLQMFVTTTKSFTTEHLHMYSANRYGAKLGSYWPPWVPMEMMFEFETNPYGFNRVVHRTSASLRYDKYNTLRLKYNEDVSGGETKTTQTGQDDESRMDRVWLEFPHLRAICDSAQYFALYIIVMDLLLYSEPLEKTRTERLEKIMLASDFSDLSGAPEMVQMLQERIRQLEEIKMHFQINERFLDRQGWMDRIAMDQDLAGCEDELFFMMKAITTAQQRVEDRREHENVAGLVHLNMSAREIAWHLIRGKDESLMEMQLTNASFDRTDNNDGSNYNSMEIGRINGYNLLPDALYPEILGPFIDENRGYFDQRHGKMLRVHWLMLEAIAGIPVVDYFEVDLVPLKVQIEREVAKKLFEYIFPGVGGNAFEGGNFSPFMVKNMLPTQEEEDESEAKGINAPTPVLDEPVIEQLPRHGSGLASLEQRLMPTTHLRKRQKKPEIKGLGISPTHHHGHGFSLFQHSDKSRSTVAGRSSASQQALAATNTFSPMKRSPSERSINTMRSQTTSPGDTDKPRRFALHRTHSDERKKEEARSDDLTQMMNRASNYMTLAFVKIPSMVLCLSYKGQGKRNIEDVHDLVFRMPTLEYRNKTWSNLDLALQLKKDIIRALIGHTGAIISNKFSHHRPSRTQQTRLREIANMSTFMSPRASSQGLGGSEDSSAVPSSSHSPERTGRLSTASGRPSTLDRSVSMSSTTASGSDAAGEKMEESTSVNGGSINGRFNGLTTPKRRMSLPRTSPQGQLTAESADHSRLRASSMSRRLSGFGERLRTRPSTSAGSNKDEDETEESKRKSRLLLGGQKLLRSLRD